MEHMSINTHPEIVPPVLYVPVDERADGELGFSLAHMFDQTTVLLAYTSLDRLLDGMGDDQGWALIEISILRHDQESNDDRRFNVEYPSRRSILTPFRGPTSTS